MEERHGSGHLRGLMRLFKKIHCLLKVAFGNYCCKFLASDSENTVTLDSKKVYQDKINACILTKEN